MPEAKVREHWRCERCQWEYGSVIPASEVYCPKGHRCRRVVELGERPSRCTVVQRPSGLVMS